MLKRLIKYDTRVISRVAIPMFIASGIISLLCCAVLYFTFGFAEEINSIFNALMMTGGLYLIGIITIFLMFVIVLFTTISRYYKSVFTDEGYLNMTIPVTKKQFLDSKIISGVIWFLLTAFVAWACVFIAIILPTLLYDTALISSVWQIIKSNVDATKTEMSFMLASLFIDLFISLIATFKDVTLVIAAITLGSVLFKRSKIFASVVFYFVIGFAEELFEDTVKALVSVVTTDNAWMELVINSAIELVIVCITGAVMYVVALGILNKKLNLE